MSEFLTGLQLSARIRDVLSGRGLRCAVAFWGSGAAELLTTSRANGVNDAKIVCDVSMGGTYPPELVKLGAPENHRLRFHDGLHSKVYISKEGAVVASANASSNGIGFTDKVHAGLTEAGTYYALDDDAWSDASRWFDKLYKNAKQIDERALALARRRWSPSSGGRPNLAGVRKGSLLDLVRSNPEAFAGIGFVFVGSPTDKATLEKAKETAQKLYPANSEGISKWPKGDVFSLWEEDDLKRWPASFFEFWMPKKKLSVYARSVAYFEPSTGAVFSRHSWPAIKHLLKNALPDAALPTLAKIGGVDAESARKVFAEFSDKSGMLFPTAADLWKTLAETDSN